MERFNPKKLNAVEDIRFAALEILDDTVDITKNWKE
jgi:hypothetical protein